MNPRENLPEIGLTEDEITDLLLLSSGAVQESESGDLPEGNRVILRVADHVLVSSNFVESGSSGKVGGDPQIILRGKSTGGSGLPLSTAYVTFVPEGAALKRPRYSATQGKLWLWMPARSLPLVVAQLEKLSVYCWIGHFPGGHYWADIHAGQ